MGDRLFLEIVAEGEIAQHFEEGVMPRGIADIVEIVVLAAGAHAFLAGDGTRRGAGFKPGEHVLERHHARVDEHQRRIVVRHQRRGRHDIVAAPEVFEEGAADFVGRGHNLRDLGEGRAARKRDVVFTVSEDVAEGHSVEINGAVIYAPQNAICTSRGTVWYASGQLVQNQPACYRWFSQRHSSQNHCVL